MSVKFTLRKWAEADVPTVVKYANNKLISDNLRDGFPHPYLEADAAAFIGAMLGDDESKGFCRAIEIGSDAVGSIGLFVKDDVYRKSAEIGYWLGEPFWNRGVVTDAIMRVCREGFERYDIVRIFAEPFAHNKGSRKALEKAGFTLEGVLKNSVCKNDVIFDSCIYALLRNS